MSTILSGRAVAEAINDETKQRVERLYNEYVFPVLATVRVGERADDVSYENGILARCEKLGIKVRRYILPVERTSRQDLELLIDELNANRLISGILLFRPLPEKFDENALCNRISVEKDVDSATDTSLSCAFLNTENGFLPCTAEACLKVLDYYHIDCAGKQAAVVGRSKVVGKPLAMLLLNRNATVTVCHSKTAGLPEITRRADIVVAATGKAKMITEDYVNQSAIVLDVGIHWDETAQRLCGDVDFESVSAKADAVTPVPGGVGSVTTAVLLSHVVDAAERSAK